MSPLPVQVHRSHRWLGMALLASALAASGGCSWLFGHHAVGPGIDLVGASGTHHVSTDAFTARVRNGLDSTTQSSSVTTDSGPSSRAFRGVQIWNLVHEYKLAGEPDTHGNWLDDFALVSGSDGYQVVFSAGELDPAFGNTHELIAVQTAGPDPHQGPSPFMTTAPLDQRQARYVSSLVRLEIKKASFEPSASVPAGRLVIDGAVQHPLTLDTKDIAVLPQTTVTFRDVTYRGALLSDILDKAGLKPTGTGKGALLTMYIVAGSRDGYHVVISLGEASPSVGARRIVVGFATGSDASANPRLIVADDLKGARSVSELSHIRVADAAALP